MGRSRSPLAFARPALAVALFGVLSTGLPQPGVAGAAATEPATPHAAVRVWSLGDAGVLDPNAVVQRYRDAEARISILPPVGWLAAPATTARPTPRPSASATVRGPSASPTHP